MEKETIGQKIKVLRKMRGLTQQQLCEKLGVKRATISNWEIGRRSPHITELEQLASILGVGLEHFGINDKDNLTDLVARAKVMFENDNISAQEKAAAYKEIMKLYLKIEE